MPCGVTTGHCLIGMMIVDIRKNIVAVLLAGLSVVSQVHAADDVLRALLIDDYREFLRGNSHALKWNTALYNPSVKYSVNDIVDVYIENEVRAKQQFEPHFNLTGDVLRVGTNDRGDGYAVFLTTLKDVLFYANVENPQLLAEHRVGSQFNMVCADLQKLGQNLAVNCFDREQFVSESIRLTFDRPDMAYFVKYAPSPQNWQSMQRFAAKVEQSPVRAEFLACMSRDEDCFGLIEQLK